MRPRLFSGGTGGKMQVIDPVCKMTIEDRDAAAMSEYKGIPYYFCALQCKETFEKNPEAYIQKETSHPRLMMLTPKKEAQGETTATRVNDPVCGMKVDPEKTDYKYVYKGTPYFFCRKQCLDAFEKDPERYLASDGM